MSNKEYVNELDFEILGQKLKFRSSSSEGNVDGLSVMTYIENEVERLRKQYPRLDNTKLAVLLAVRMAEEKLKTDLEYKNSVEKFGVLASDALSYIDEVYPS